MLGYWTIIGLRAAFFVPSELPAAWAFARTASDHSRALVRGARLDDRVHRASVLFIDLLLAPILGGVAWPRGRRGLERCGHPARRGGCADNRFHPVHAGVCRPGHAKLKTRWPLYLIGLYVFAFWPARLQLWMSGDAASSLQLAAGIGVAIAIAEFAGRQRAARWTAECEEEPDDEFCESPFLISEAW